MRARGEHDVSGNTPSYARHTPAAFGSPSPVVAAPSPNRSSTDAASRSPLVCIQSPKVLEPTTSEQGKPSVGEYLNAGSTPLTPLLLQDRFQDRLKETAVKVDGVLRNTNEAHSRLVAQDARLGLMQEGLLLEGSPSRNINRLDQLRQHIDELRSVVAEDGNRVPGALQHVQRMLLLLAGQARAVDSDPAGGREVLDSIEVLRREVAQLMEVTTKGEQTVGEVMSIRKTLQDLQEDLNTASGLSSSATSPVLSSARLGVGTSRPAASSSVRSASEARDARQNKVGEVAAELAELRAQVSALAAEGQRTAAEAAGARRDVMELRDYLRLRRPSRPTSPWSRGPTAGQTEVTRVEPRNTDYSDELVACTADSSLSDNGMRRNQRVNAEIDAAAHHAVHSSIDEQLHVITLTLSNFDARLKQTEEGLRSMASPSETLLVSKQLVHNLRQELTSTQEELRSKVDALAAPSSASNGSCKATPYIAEEQKNQELVSRKELSRIVGKLERQVKNVSMSPRSPSGPEAFASLEPAAAAELVRAGLGELREAGRLAHELGLHAASAAPTLPAAASSANEALVSEVKGLRNDVDQLNVKVARTEQAAEDVDASKRSITRLFTEVNKMKATQDTCLVMEDFEQRFQSLRQELLDGIADRWARSPQPQSYAPATMASPASTKSDFAALREGLNSLKLKHTAPQESQLGLSMAEHGLSMADR